MGAGQVTRAVMVMVQLKVRLKATFFDHLNTNAPQAFPYLTSLIGMEGIFFLHSSTLLLGAAFALVALPETRNKSLTQLEQIFVRKEEQGQDARKEKQKQDIRKEEERQEKAACCCF